FKRFTPMSKLVGSGCRDMMLVSSSSLAKRALWSRLSNPQISRCNTLSIKVAIPIVIPAPAVFVAGRGLAPFAAVTMLLWQSVEVPENPVLVVSQARQRQHAHAGVV